MILLRFLFCLILFTIPAIASAEEPARHFPKGTCDIYIPPIKGVRRQLLKNIALLVKRSIDKGLYPGAVVLAAHHGKVIYRGIFGNRRIAPDIAPMTYDTIFDVASLTKAVVTTTAIMQLVEQGKLDLDAPVCTYWPKFSLNGKQNVTVRELLTHTSGFPAGITVPGAETASAEPINKKLSKYRKEQVLMIVEKEPLIHPHGTVFTYSDVNFITLGHLVEIITGEQLDTYARKHIFKPLEMQRSFYLPPSRFKNEIAPTQIIHGKLRWGAVHDGTAYFMGGVSGMAGLFSTAKDLGIFAQCLLNGGRVFSPCDERSNKHILGPLTILKMTSPQTPKQMTDIHGLGWDIDTRYSIRGALFSTKSYGHTGWTGTSIWIDPTTQTWLIILTSRSHPTLPHTNQLIHDRVAIANIVAGSIIDVPSIKDKEYGSR